MVKRDRLLTDGPTIKQFLLRAGPAHGKGRPLFQDAVYFFMRSSTNLFLVA